MEILRPWQQCWTIGPLPLHRQEIIYFIYLTSAKHDLLIKISSCSKCIIIYYSCVMHIALHTSVSVGAILAAAESLYAPSITIAVVYKPPSNYK